MNNYSEQNEIKSKDVLLDKDGRLKHRGYSRSFLLDYNPENIRIFPLKCMNRLRLKEWDYYGVTTRDFFFSATVADIGYLGLTFVYFVDFKSKEVFEKIYPTPFGMKCKLPRSSESGDISFKAMGRKLTFLREEEQRIVKVHWKNFQKGDDLSANLVLQQPADMDSIVMATPIGDKHFYYNHKINCMPTGGEITIGEKKYELNHDNALTTLDWGRGVWEYKTLWNWASASGFLEDGRTIGLNLGKGFGDLSHATENCFFIDGKITKLGWVELEYDPSDYKKPWTFTSDDGKLQLTLTPFIEKKNKMNILVLRTEVHQMFGHYSGTLVTDEGEKIIITDLIGWAEEHQARW